MKGYKAFNNDLSCRDFQYEIGKTYAMDSNVHLCERGFHFCKYPSQVFAYYHEDARMCLVEANGKILEGEDKCVCSQITILREITGVEHKRILYGGSCGNGYIDGDGDGNGCGNGYGYTDGDGNGNGYNYTDGDGNGCGCGHEYYYGYSDRDCSGNGHGCGIVDVDGDGEFIGYDRINNVLIFKEG
ncbi:hypothetical protein IKF03_02340 [Candidatus Saccharibacteria bacterium]|nr:hypothetical protein [Candidatus Saccharibacteria bacterium]